jgi:hypothetical protein
VPKWTLKDSSQAIVVIICFTTRFSITTTGDPTSLHHSSEHNSGCKWNSTESNRIHSFTAMLSLVISLVGRSIQ